MRAVRWSCVDGKWLFTGGLAALHPVSNYFAVEVSSAGTMFPGDVSRTEFDALKRKVDALTTSLRVLCVVAALVLVASALML